MTLEKQKNFLIRFSYYAVLIVLAYLSLKYVLPLLTPFVFAFAFAYVLRRPIRFLSAHTPLPRRLVAVIIVLLFFGVVGLLTTLFCIQLVAAITNAAEAVPQLYYSQLQPFFLEVYYTLEALLLEMDPTTQATIQEAATQLLQILTRLASSISLAVMSFASGAATSLPGIFIGLVLMIISTFFISMDFDQLTGFCLRQLSDNAKALFLEAKHFISGTLWVCLRSYVLLMTLTFVESYLCFRLIGISSAALVAAALALVDILPILGISGIMLPWVIVVFLQGEVFLGLKLTATYLLLISVRNTLEPKIVGAQLGLHPVVTLCSMFAGSQLFGLAGLFGFPIFLSLLRHLNDCGKIHLFK